MSNKGGKAPLIVKIVVAVITALGVITAAVIASSRSADPQGHTGPEGQAPTVLPSSPPFALETPNVRPSQGFASPVPGNNGGALILQLDFGNYGKIGQDTYRNPMRFGWISKVFDDNGEVKLNCYIKWSLYKRDQKIYTDSANCNDNPLTGMNLGPGEYTFVGSITTDSGRSATGSKKFVVAG
jgi:hypothetical protein